MWTISWLWAVAAHATPVFERPVRRNYLVGLDLLVYLGPRDDHARFGVAVDGGVQQNWHDKPYYTDDFRLEPSPVWQLMATAGLAPGRAYTEVTGQVGGLVNQMKKTHPA